jgi:hypothetical protein
MLFSLLSAPYPPVQFAQTKMAMRDERAHAEIFSEGESLAILVLRLPDIKGIFARRDLAKEAKSVRLVSSLFVLTGESQGALCGGTGSRLPTGQQIRFAQPDGPRGLALIVSAHDGALDGLLQEGNCLSTAPGERVGIA